MKRISLVVLLFVGVLFITGCGKDEGILIAGKRMEKDSYVVLDVRTNSEYAESHVKGSINIPYDEIDETTDLDKTKTILVYCKSGVRSNKAYNTLKSLGYDVVDLGAYNTVTLEKE